MYQISQASNETCKSENSKTLEAVILKYLQPDPSDIQSRAVALVSQGCLSTNVSKV